jgi:hypothetical protein
VRVRWSKVRKRNLEESVMNQTNGELANLSSYNTDSSCNFGLVLQLLQKPPILLISAVGNFMDEDVWLS